MQMSAPTGSRSPTKELDDLRSRIAATRWPERETVTDDTQGVPLALMQDLARYWATRLRLAHVRGEAQRACRTS